MMRNNNNLTIITMMLILLLSMSPPLHWAYHGIESGHAIIYTTSENLSTKTINAGRGISLGRLGSRNVLPNERYDQFGMEGGCVCASTMENTPNSLDPVYLKPHASWEGYLSGPHNLTDYQVLIILTPENFNYSHVKPDGSDIRLSLIHI